MGAEQSTFTVIVVAIHGDKADAIRGLTEAFAIGLQNAAAIVERAPIRVKRGLSGAEAKDVVAKLLVIGADVSVRNEQTGKEKTYQCGPMPDDEPPSVLRPPSRTATVDIDPPSPPRAPPPPPPPPSVRAAPPPPPPAVVEEAAPEPPPMPAPPPADEGRIDLAALLADAGVAPLAALLEGSEPPPAEDEDENPASTRAPDPSEFAPGTATATPIAAPNRIVPFAEFTKPKTEQDLKQTPAQPLGKCVACKRFVEKGGTCNFCGWSRDTNKRACRSCGKDIAVARGLPRSAWGVALALGVIAAVALAFFRGLWAGIGAVPLVAGITFLIDASRVRYRCVACKRDADAEWLLPAEKTQFRGQRVKWAGAGALCFAVAGGAGALSAATAKAMSFDSFGVTYRTTLPHSHQGSPPAEKVVKIPSEWGEAQLFEKVAVNHKGAIHTYVLEEIILPRDTDPVVDTPELDRLMQAGVADVVAGTKFSGVGPAKAQQVEGREARFTGDGSAFGRARAFVYGKHEIVVVFYVASSGDDLKNGDATDYLNSYVAAATSD